MWYISTTFLLYNCPLRCWKGKLVVYTTALNFSQMKICNICHRPINSYYRTKAYKIYCYDCWKGERERILHYRDEAIKQSKQEWQQYRILEKKISELRDKLDYEQNKREEYQNPSYIKQLYEELHHLSAEKGRIKTYGLKFPRIDDDIMTAKYFESDAAEVSDRNAEVRKREEGWERLEAARKFIEEERKKAEEARIAQMKKEKEEALLKEKNRIMYENEIAVINELSYYNGRRLNQNDYMLLAYNSMNESVLKKLMQSKDLLILKALLKNPSVSQEMQREIMRQ